MAPGRQGGGGQGGGGQGGGGQGGRGQGTGGGGKRQGMGGGRGLGPAGECICPNCGEKVPHERGTPCFDMTCKKCGTSMARA